VRQGVRELIRGTSFIDVVLSWKWQRRDRARRSWSTVRPTTVDGFAEHVAAVVEMALRDVPHCRSTIAGGNAVRKGSPDFRAS